MAYLGIEIVVAAERVDDFRWERIGKTHFELMSMTHCIDSSPVFRATLEGDLG